MWSLDYNSYHETFISKLKNNINLLENIDVKKLDDQQYSAYVHLRSAIYELINLYGVHTFTKYNKENVDKISSVIKKDINSKSVTIITTTCKRYDLFERTINSFIDCCLDLDKYIYEYIVIDDQSSEQDIKLMCEKYPFIQIIRKNKSSKGHANSMNFIKDLVKTDYFIILEDDWEFVVKDNFITKCFEVFNQPKNTNIGQVLFNMNYAEDFTVGPNINSSDRFYTSNNLPYLIHSYKPNVSLPYPNCHYWPHFSFRVGVTKTKVLRDVGDFVTKPIHFEMDYAHRYTDKGYKTAFLDCIAAYHTGRRTYERNNSDKLNAYDLNSESQFGQEVKTKEKPVNSEQENIIGVINNKQLTSKTQFNIKSYVINLERRPTRLYNFFNQFPLTNYIHVFDGTDGKQLKPNQKIQKLFETGDFDYRKGIVGCALSHMTVWQEILNNAALDYLLIFEDDAVPVYDFNKKLMHLISNYHGKFDVLYLGMFAYPNRDKAEWHYNSDNYDKLPLAKQFSKSDCFSNSMGGNHGYLISRKGVLNCLEYINRYGMTNAIDWMVMHTADTNRVFYSFPFIVEGDCYQTANKNDYQTDIQLEYDSVKFTNEEYYTSELQYWKNKFPDKFKDLTNDFENIDMYILNNIVLAKNSQKVLDFISNKPVKYYTVNEWIFIVPETMLDKNILEEKTFIGYLNKSKYY